MTGQRKTHSAGLRGARRRAGSLIETVIFILITSVLLSGIISLTSLVGRANTRAQTESPMANSSRTSIDEINYDIRAASALVSSYTAYSTTYTASATTCILKAPAYNMTLSNPAISGVYDYICLSYNPGTQELTETIVPGAGSTRSARHNFVLAQHVASFQFTYYSRSQSTMTAPTCTLPLCATPLSLPNVYVKGALSTSFTYVLGSTTMLLTNLDIGADIEIIFPVSPTANGGADLSTASEVDATMTQSKADDLGVTRSVTLQAGARLRNQRN